MNLHPALVRELRNRKFEISDSGLYLPKSKVMVSGVFGNQVRKATGELTPVEWSPNIIVNQGLDSILGVYFHADSQISTWYVAIFEGNYTPVAGDTAANIATNSTESTAYTEANRVEWVEAAAASQSITNSASKATFTMNATKTIYGAFLVSTSTKSGATGTLCAASRFTASRSVVNTDQLLVTYTITAADA